MNPDPIRNLGPWSFTLQQDTPVHWLRTGPLSNYLCKMQVEVHVAPGAVISTGVLLHSGDDVLGGGSVWLEVKDGRKVYCLGGNDLASRPVITKEYAVTSQVKNGRNVMTEDWEFLMQENSGCAFFNDRRIRIKFKLKRSEGTMAFFNSSQSPAWDDPEAFDQIFNGVDVVFRDIRITAVTKTIQLDSFLEYPGLTVTEPMKKVKDLWNQSEGGTVVKKKRLKDRKVDGGGKFGKREPEVGDVKVADMKTDIDLDEVQKQLKDDEENMIEEAAARRHPLAEQIERERRPEKGDSGPVNLFRSQEKLVKDMEESVLFSKPNVKPPRFGVPGIPRSVTPSRRRPRACPHSEDELMKQRREYSDYFFKRGTELTLKNSEYMFGVPPTKEYNTMGQHPLDPKRPSPQKNILRRSASEASVKRWGATLRELRRQPAMTEIPEDELLKMKERTKTQLENVEKRLERTRELLGVVALKRAAVAEDYPLPAVQHVQRETLELEQRQHREQQEQLTLMERVREIDLELDDLRQQKPTVKDLLPESLRKLLEADEKRQARAGGRAIKGGEQGTQHPHNGNNPILPVDDGIRGVRIMEES